jgi:multidrug efflux pump subunit AcrB
MFFGISMSPMAWLYTIIAALMLVFTPLFLVESFAKNFDEPFRTIIILIGSYILVPMLVGYLYKQKVKKTGRGSVIFKIYFGMYALFFIVFTSHLFTKGFSWDDFAGVVVLGGVLAYMYSIIKKSQKIIQEQQQNLKEYEIEIQKEAILRASKELQE